VTSNSVLLKEPITTAKRERPMTSRARSAGDISGKATEDNVTDMWKRLCAFYCVYRQSYSWGRGGFIVHETH
jgi:hypothetical protein